ncbi:hypothetical protein [Nesterenkonia muleiensis]|uniref:hypothetical protein n=1 Tax=Nesterenkonia muleiensis TaxID=2282648 RepID=UPI000E73120B|nr:hypothetical protein [Nesterenkonia muleiensis]
MKTQSESLPSIENETQERLTGLRKIIAIGSLAPFALSACGDNTEAKGPEPTVVQETVDETEPEDTDTVETEAPTEEVVEYDEDELEWRATAFDKEAAVEFIDYLGGDLEECDDPEAATEPCIGEPIFTTEGSEIYAVEGANEQALEWIQNRYPQETIVTVQHVDYHGYNDSITINTGRVPQD